MKHRTSNIPACIVLGLLLSFSACQIEDDRALLPTGPSLSEIPGQDGPPYRLPQDALGPPRAFDRIIEIDVPAELPDHFLSDDALVAAVEASGGWVHIGFKEPAQPRLVDRVVGSPEGLRARVGPVGLPALREGRGLLQGRGIDIVLPFSDLPGVVSVMPPDQAPILRQHPLVDYVEPVTSGSPGDTPQVTPGNLTRIRAPQAWALSRGSGVYVVIMDTGAAGGFSHHPDLPQLGPYTCLVTIPNDTNCADDPLYAFYGHGIQVAGVALARDNTIDVVGVAPSTSSFWTSIRVCGPLTGCGNAAVVSALNWVAQNGRKDVVNMSFHGNYSAQVATAVASAYSAGDLLVAIAGNTNVTQTVTYPGRYSQVIAVSGTTASDQFDPGSVSGAEVELSAPYSVQTLGATSGKSSPSGTSFASPAVAGVGALVWAQNPGWSNASVRQKLQGSVEDYGPSGRDAQFGYGRIDACFAVEAGCQSVIPIGGTLVGPTEVPPGEFCTWQMLATGARKPYTYQWSGAVSGTNLWASGSLSSSGWIYVTTTAKDGQQLNRSLFVTVSSSASPCVE